MLFKGRHLKKVAHTWMFIFFNSKNVPKNKDRYLINQSGVAFFEALPCLKYLYQEEVGTLTPLQPPP